MAEVAIRPATLDDVPGMRDLGTAVVPATYDPVDAAYGRHLLATYWTLDAMRAMVRERPHLVAVDGDRLVGLANLGPHADRQVMFRLYVHPERQGEGIGGALLGGIVELNDDRPLWLQRIDGNERAAAFYAAHGFEERERQPNPPYRDQIWMERPA